MVSVSNGRFAGASLLILGIAAAPAAGEESEKRDGSPPAIHVPEPRRELGKVLRGETVRHRVWYENRGGSKLVIHRIRPSWGRVERWATRDRELAPGAKGSFDLVLDTSMLSSGRGYLCATIASNDPRVPAVPVRFQVAVESLVKNEPALPKIEWVRGTEGPRQTEIQLMRAGDRGVHILGATSESGRLAVDLREVEPTSTYRLIVKAKHGLDTKLPSREKIALHIRVGDRRLTQKFSVRIHQRERIEAQPGNLHFLQRELARLKEEGTPVVKTAVIKAVLKAPYRFKITSVKADRPDPFVKLRLKPVEEGREYRLEVMVHRVPELSERPKDSRRLKDVITLATDDPELPAVRVNCVATFWAPEA